MRISDWSSDVCSSDLLSVATRSWDRYSVLAYGNAPGSGVYVRPYVRLTGRAVSGPGLVKGRRMDALLGLELLDAARGTLLGRAERDGDWTLASRGWGSGEQHSEPPVINGNPVCSLLLEKKNVSYDQKTVHNNQ